MTVFLIPYFYFLGKRRSVWAGVFWGLAFGTKNQAALALAPLLAEGIWRFFAAAGAGKRKVIVETVRTFVVVIVVGLLVSTPFGNPMGNVVEVFKTSDPDITAIQDPSNLFFQWPLWFGMGLLGLLGVKFIEDARDSYDRMNTFMLLIPTSLYFIADYRSYMLVPSLAILVGTYFRRGTAWGLIVVLFLADLVGLRSPYLTSRHLLYDFLNRPGAPQTIEEIERLPGVGTIPSGNGAQKDKPSQ